MLDAHIPTTLRAQAASKASPRVVKRKHSNHPSSADCERSKPHALSNAHIPTTLRAQAASEASPTRRRRHTYQPPFERRLRAKRVPRVGERTYTSTLSNNSKLPQPSTFTAQTASKATTALTPPHQRRSVRRRGCVGLCLVSASWTAMQSLHIPWKPLLVQCSPCISLGNPFQETYNIRSIFLYFEILSSKM